MRRAVLMTPALAHFAGVDAANKQMRAAGRTKWNHADFTVAATMQNTLVAECGGTMQRLAALECLGRKKEFKALQTAISRGEA